MKYLVCLAHEDPERFDAEWERRMSSWLELIRRDAGRWKNSIGNPVPPVFSIVDEAMTLLEGCGRLVYEKYAKEAHDLLTSECCRLFGFHSGLRHVRTSPRLFL